MAYLKGTSKTPFGETEPLGLPVPVLEYQQKNWFGIIVINYYIEDRRPDLEVYLSKYKYYLTVNVFGKEIFALSGRLDKMPHQFDAMKGEVK
jgi:hypothetical protein